MLPPLVLLWFGAVELKPYADRITAANSRGEDWLSYKGNGLEILTDGVLFPARPHDYARPAGFLYNYWVALLLMLGGLNDVVVAFVQLLFVGVAAVVMYVTFRDRLGDDYSILYLILVTALFVWERAFWETLLSETLLVILVPWVFFFLRSGFRDQSRRDVMIAGFVAGLCTLTRPNAGLMIPVLAGVLFIYERRERRERRGTVVLPLLFCVAAALGQLPLVARNVAVTHKVSMGTFSPALVRTGDWAGVHAVPLSKTMTSELTGSVRSYVRRIAICFGYVSLVQAGKGRRIAMNELVPDWIVMWLGVLLYVIAMKRMQRPVSFEEGMLAGFIASYLLPAVLFTDLTNYSGRVLVPVFASVLVLSVLGLARFFEMLRLEAPMHGQAARFAEPTERNRRHAAPRG